MESIQYLIRELWSKPTAKKIIDCYGNKRFCNMFNKRFYTECGFTVLNLRAMTTLWIAIVKKSSDC